MNLNALALRQSDGYRHVSAQEWAEFEKHFQLRRVELGDCFRPYGTPLRARARPVN
jgi:hypothetical protein